MESCDNTVRRAAQSLVSGEDLGHTSTSPLPASLSNKSYFDNMTAGWCWCWVVGGDGGGGGGAGAGAGGAGAGAGADAGAAAGAGGAAAAAAAAVACEILQNFTLELALLVS